MYAAVPFYNLAKLHEEIKNDLPETKAGLIRNWIDIMPIVKRQRTEPDFCFVPQLPNSA